MSAFGQYEQDQSASAMKMRDYKDATDLVCSIDTRNDVLNEELSATLQAKSTGGQSMACINPVIYQLEQITSPQNGNNPKPGDPAPPLTTDGRNVVVNPVLLTMREGKEGGGKGALISDISLTLATDNNQTLFHPVQSPTLTAYNLDSRSPQSEEQQRIVSAVFDATTTVRRLTPTECERLQGFPDGYVSKVPGATETACYKALGNSMTTNVMKWIGERIDLVDKIISSL